ncbi:MAG: hypothetical protein ACRDH5_02620 [bacterium]
MIDRRRISPVVAVAAGLAVTGLLALGAGALVGAGGIPTGSALDNEGAGGILQPLPPDTPLSLGIVYLKNVSRKPIELVNARLLRLDPDLELLGFSALSLGPGPWGMNPPITALEHPLAGAVPLSEFPPLPPAPDKHAQAKVMFALKVKPGGSGKAVGVEVRYRQDGKLRQQVFKQQVYVCWVPSWGDNVDCPGVGREMDVFGEYEDEVKRISGRRRD